MAPICKYLYSISSAQRDYLYRDILPQVIRTIKSTINNKCYRKRDIEQRLQKINDLVISDVTY